VAFWTKQLGTGKGQSLQPKFGDRFIVMFGGTNSSFASNIVFTVKSVDKPSVQIDTKEFKLVNHKFKYPGTVTWQPIKMTFVDMAGSFNDGITIPQFEYFSSEHTNIGVKGEKLLTPNFQNTAMALAYLLYSSGYDTPGFETVKGMNTAIQKNLSINSFNKITIQMLDTDYTPDSPNNIKVVESWELFNPIVRSINWGSLAYTSGDLVECTLDIDYDFAEISSGQLMGQEGLRVDEFVDDVEEAEDIATNGEENGEEVEEINVQDDPSLRAEE
jgi:hypothetical protein